MIIDTHAHLYWDSYSDDLDQVVASILDAGVTTVINVGTDLETCEKSINQEFSRLVTFSSVGIHPHEVVKYLTDVSIRNDIDRLGDLYHSHPKKVTAIGECGLDYYFGGGDFIPSSLSQDQHKEVQKKLYLAQIALAKELKLPLIIHCRDAWDEIFVPELNGTTGVFHTFTGSVEDAQKALDLGYYLSFSCIITYPKNEPLREILKQIPLDGILTETDSPFLPPQAIRGKRNDPSKVVEVIKVIADLKGISFEKAAETTYQNAKKLFDF